MSDSSFSMEKRDKTKMTTALGKFKIPKDLPATHEAKIIETMTAMEEHIEGSGGR